MATAKELAAALGTRSINIDALARDHAENNAQIAIDKALALHAEAMARLRVELTDSRYSGKTGEEIQSLLLAEEFGAVQRPAGPSPMQQIIAGLLARIMPSPVGLFITDEGEVLSEHPKVQQKLDELIAATGKPRADLLVVPLADVKVSLRPAPMSALWARLPYLANVPTLEDIAEARQ